MLDVLRKNSRNAIIYVLFGVIIAVFVINFGPGSRTDDGGGFDYAVKVSGSPISEMEYRYAYIAMGYGNEPAQFSRQLRRREFVMDRIIERELRAQEADRLGFEVSKKQIEQMVEDGRMYIFGNRVKVEEFAKDGVFDYERFSKFCQNRLGVTVKRFIEQQQRELMADEVKQLVLGATKVTPDEVKSDYDQKNLQVNLEYVRFAKQLGDDAAPTAAEVEAWKKTHEAEVQKIFETRSYLYKKVDKHARLRQILVTAAKGAPEAEVAAAKVKIDDAKKKIDGGQDFAEIAKQVSDDAHTKGRGGDGGWRKKGFTGLGTVLDEKVFTAKEATIIGPERTDRGFELVKVEGFREGDLTIAQVGTEIAEELLRTESGKVKARADAEAAAAKVKGGAKLEELFPKLSDTGETTDPAKGKAAAGGAHLEETGLFARRGDIIPELGIAPELAKRAFDLKVGELVGPFDVGGGVVVARLKERKEPDGEYFEKHKEEELRKAAKEKGAEVLSAWTQKRCIEVRDDGRIKVNENVLSYDGTPAKPGESRYEACQVSQPRSMLE
ncbi:MAG: hypothetical protein EXR72_14685 [Myxococcales bacterium]|nr:hypothetical protein [Myxococcales bacterium]